MGFPLMAGSSLPVTWRRPELEFKLGTKITEALVASRGELEIYGIHALEALQCMVERRFTNAAPRPANQGVKAVTCLQGDAVWKAGDDGVWSWELLEHALGRSPSRNAGDIRANCQRFPRPAYLGVLREGTDRVPRRIPDGLKATVSATRWPRRGRDVRSANRRREEAAIVPVLASAAPGRGVPRSARVARRELPHDRQAALPGRANATHRRHPRTTRSNRASATRSGWKRPTSTSATTRQPTAASCAATTASR